jgi:hypothetical protein
MYILMNAVIKNTDFSSDLPLKKAMESFFINNPPHRVEYLFWKLFQCYVLKDCNIKVEVPEKEIALFYDQLMDLVTAAYIVHQANRGSQNRKEEDERR